MILEEFINNLIADGWLLKRMEGKNMVFNRPYSDDNGALREVPDYDYPLIRIDFVNDAPLVTIWHNKGEVFPQIEKRSLDDFKEEDDGTITCTREIRRNMMEWPIK